ncbi:HNH endonuclease [Desulfococcaceae bacterium HSG7]|nr:HNH endonuclease [Desulfococcaceae bacterium HSG7]
MPMGEDDLKNLRDRVKERLSDLIEATPIIIHRTNAQNLYNSCTKCWYANIGKFSIPQTGIAQTRFLIFLDDQYYNNKISYFIETQDEQIMYEFLDRINYRKLFGPIVRTIKENDWKTNKVQIIDTFTINQFDNTFLELTPSLGKTGRFYYGKCDSSNDISDELVDKIVSFYLDIGHAIAANPIDEYSATENRKLVTKHIIRERNSNLSSHRKRRDGYQCQICKMKFEKVYGEIGKNFAEAHHIIPLAQLETTQRTTINDLVTVCANCHRMLHKLNGERGDIERLQNAIQYIYDI